MATGSACVTTRWVLLPRPSRAAPAACCAGAFAASFCCARDFARPGMSNRWRTARTPSSVVMVSTLFGVNDLPAVRDGQRGVAFNGCPLDDLHQAFWPGLRSIIPDDLVTMLADLKPLFHQRRHGSLLSEIKCFRFVDFTSFFWSCHEPACAGIHTKST